jgi:hypothetical protein
MLLFKQLNVSKINPLVYLKKILVYNENREKGEIR